MASNKAVGLESFWTNQADVVLVQVRADFPIPKVFPAHRQQRCSARLRYVIENVSPRVHAAQLGLDGNNTAPLGYLYHGQARSPKSGIVKRSSICGPERGPWCYPSQGSSRPGANCSVYATAAVVPAGRWKYGLYGIATAGAHRDACRKLACLERMADRST